MNTPQAVTIRYSSGLLKRGWNNEFDLLTVSRDAAVVDDVCVGTFFNVTIKRIADNEHVHAVGTTPIEAVERCLVKLGVTFR